MQHAEAGEDVRGLGDVPAELRVQAPAPSPRTSRTSPACRSSRSHSTGATARSASACAISPRPTALVSPAAALPARLRQHEDRQEQREQLQRGGEQERHREPVAPGEPSAGRRAEHETRAERGADVRERLAAALRLDQIADVRLRDADVAAGEPFERAREQHERNRRSQRHQRPGDRRTDLRDDQHHLAADAIAHVSPHRPGDELADRVRREHDADHDVGRAELQHEERQQRDQDAEAQDVDEGDAEDRQQPQDQTGTTNANQSAAVAAPPHNPYTAHSASRRVPDGTTSSSGAARALPRAIGAKTR